jgi:hypothetical protein
VRFIAVTPVQAPKTIRIREPLSFEVRSLVGLVGQVNSLAGFFRADPPENVFTEMLQPVAGFCRGVSAPIYSAKGLVSLANAKAEAFDGHDGPDGFSWTGGLWR